MIYNSLFIAGQEIFFLIIIVVIIAVVISLVRKRNNSNIIVKDESVDIGKIQEEQNTSSLKILKERLAKGEITKEEFNKLKSEFETQ